MPKPVKYTLVIQNRRAERHANMYANKLCMPILEYRNDGNIKDNKNNKNKNKLEGPYL